MIASLISLLIYLIVIGLVVWLALYVLDNLPLADPFRRIARVVVMVIAMLLVIFLLLGTVDGDYRRIVLP